MEDWSLANLKLFARMLSNRPN